MSAAELIGMSLAELTDAYASRALSPVEVLRATLSHSENVNTAINALFCFRPSRPWPARYARKRDGRPGLRWVRSMAFR